jgi:Septum formation
MRRFVVTVVLVSVALTAAPLEAEALGVGGKTARTVPLPRWVRSVCGRLGDWGNALDKADSKLQKELEDLDSGKVSAKAAKARLVRAASDETKATSRLIASIEELGTPVAANAKTVASSFSDALSDYRRLAVDQQRSYSRLDTDTKKSRESAQDIETRIEEKAAEIGDPLEGPRADPEFAAALNGEPLCTALLPRFTPTTFVVGDCLNADTPDAILDEYETVPCTQKHLEEVFVVTNHPAGPGDPFPGEAAINSFAESTCTPEFRTYVGEDFESSRLGFSYFTPDKETWPLGDRQIVCTVDQEDGSPLRGSVKGSGGAN